jgi:serine/threonine protein kinase
METGTTIGHYKILRQLGKGGMGEVYLADDTKLDRQVAIKILPEMLRSDTERLARFRREAKAAASLKHNNIATIYSLEEVDNILFIVMEYVEGETLSTRIPSDGMDLDTFFNTFIPLSDALTHAHNQGRIHRDLKPANIMITLEGIPKILDFGLARIIDMDSIQTAYASDTSQDVDSQSPTRTMKAEEQGIPSLTRGGQLMGTPVYMSPEQAEHKPTDGRTDLFSFGIVMYEALTGQRPFQGDTIESIIGRILTEEPKPVSDLKPVTPHQLWWTIKKSLKKDCDRRTQTAMELHTELQDVQQEMQSGTVLVDASTIPKPVLESVEPEPVPFWRQPVAVALMVVLAFMAVGSAIWMLKPVPELPLRKFQILIDRRAPKISPDGTMIAYIENNRLWVQDLDQVAPREIANTEGAGTPFWSPNSDWIGYINQAATPPTLNKVPSQGGASITLCVIQGYGPTWGTAGTIVFTGWDRGLFEVSDRGGQPRVLLEPDSTEFAFSVPHFLPDGKSLLVPIIVKGDSATVEQAAQRVESSNLGQANWMRTAGLVSMEIKLFANGTRRTLVTSLSGEWADFPIYTPNGHLLYQRRLGRDSHTIWAVPFSLSSFTVTGEPFVVAQEVRGFSVSADGTLVYRSVSTSAGTQQLVWVDRTGRVTGMIGQPQEEMIQPALSPDGRNVAVSAAEHGNRDIWLHDIERGTKIRLTFDPSEDFGSAWSPDGIEVVFHSLKNGNRDIFKKRADGSGRVEPLITGPRVDWFSDWSRDGRHLVYASNEKGPMDIWMVSLDDNQSPVPLMETPHHETWPALSPNGQYIAYQSNESGRNQVYVRSFPEGESRWQVSSEGGLRPRWNGDGTELFFVSGDDMMAVEVSTHDVFRSDIHSSLFSASSVGAMVLGLNYDVSADGQRFVVVQQTDTGETPKLTVVQNWYKEFEGRK